MTFQNANIVKLS